MILKTFISNLVASVQGLDLLDADASDLQEARAFLFPVSQSAVYSCCLVEGAPLVFEQSFNCLSSNVRSTLPSPRDTEDEDDEPPKRKPTRPPCSTSTVIQKPEHTRKIPLILLQQTHDDEKFTLGSSLQSDIVLKRSKSEPESCWVNLQHCVLYPDPDDTSILLHNLSRCEFGIRRLEAEDKVQIVKPGSKLVIPEGAWHLNLGKGFDFQIKVLQRSKEWSDIHNALIASVEISAKPLYAAKEERVEVLGEFQVRRNRISSRLSTDGYNHVVGGATALARRRTQPQPPTKEAVNQTTEVPDESIPISQRSSLYTVALTDDELVTRSSQGMKGNGRENLDVENVETGSTLQETKCSRMYENTVTVAPTHTTSSSWVGKYGRMSSQNTVLGQTRTSRVVKRIVANGIVHAVKMCRHLDHVTAAESWRTEAEILKSLNHASIIRLFKFDAVHLSLELEYFPDGSLDRYRDEQSMCTISLDTVYNIWLDICKGLEYIHARGIIHCDVKLGNILMKSGGEGAVLIDFGIALTCPTVEGRGTPCYVPPEGLYGKWSFHGDVWGLGVVLLWGLRLMPLPNRTWIIANIQTDAHAAHEMGDWLLYVTRTIEKIPKHLNSLCKMLEFNPANRISARGSVQDLERSNWLKGSKLMEIRQ